LAPAIAQVKSAQVDTADFAWIPCGHTVILGEYWRNALRGLGRNKSLHRRATSVSTHTLATARQVLAFAEIEQSTPRTDSMVVGLIQTP
jgi:hypothetical protein